MPETRKSGTCARAWDALADTHKQAAKPLARVELVQQAAAILIRPKWTQLEVAAHRGITQPRMNGLLRGGLSRFSLDALGKCLVIMACG